MVLVHGVALLWALLCHCSVGRAGHTFTNLFGKPWKDFSHIQEYDGAVLYNSSRSRNAGFRNARYGSEHIGGL